MTNEDDINLGVMRESVILCSQANERFMQRLLGFPFRPCPICGATEECQHVVVERARAYGHNIVNATEHLWGYH